MIDYMELIDTICKKKVIITFFWWNIINKGSNVNCKIKKLLVLKKIKFYHFILKHMYMKGRIKHEKNYFNLSWTFNKN